VRRPDRSGPAYIVILLAASKVYGAAASWRRRWYARDPSRRRRLERPVVSIGNLSVGGSGKTPVVAHIAALLAASGERPAILSRGYGRTAPHDGVTIVSDGANVLAPLEQAGDEPLMLARALTGVAVVVATDRHAAGKTAEEKLGATVHVLDDGFQHLMLSRDVDLLLVAPDDLSDQVLPAGRLREPVSAAASADALLITGGAPGTDEHLKRALGVPVTFRVRRSIGPPRWLETGEPADLGPGERMLAVAGIARPARFFADLADANLSIAATETFRDHHPYTDGDVERIVRARDKAGATLVVTTEKDAVRLSARALRDLRVAVVPLTATIEPPSFVDWLLTKVRARAGARS
jgi:tetraacyldisaccharide 4'-kinase